MFKIKIVLMIIIIMSCSVYSSECRAFCAASLVDVISEIRDEYQKKSEDEVKLNFASSGMLANQIKQGARVDVYISASKKWVDYLLDKKLLESSKCFTKNSLVLITQADGEVPKLTPESPEFVGAIKEGKLSIADPEHVPAGVYAKIALTSLGLWGEVSQYLVLSKDVRGALHAVECGEVEFGVVYATDEEKSEKVIALYTFAEDSHPPIVYYAGVADVAADNDFYNFLSSPVAKSILKKHGFVSINKE